VATEAEAAELGHLVASDAGVARALASAARLESSLEVVMRHQDHRPAPASPPQEIARWRPSRALSLAGVGLAAAAAGLALVWSFARPQPPVERAGALRPAAESATEEEGTSRRSGGGAAPRRLHFADGSTADLRDGRSRLATRVSTPASIDLVLIEGSARFEVVPRPNRRFRIWVESTYVEVIGTVFTVERLPAGVRVAVERGLVKVVSGRNEMRLSAGAADVVPLPAPEQPAAERVEEPAPAAGSPRTDLGTFPGAAPSLSRDEPGALLHASEAARRAGRPEDAVTLLRRILERHPGDPRAPYTAFILGRVLLEELGRPRDAAAAFARVEALDPRTPLVQDAIAREAESWSRAGEAGRARRRAQAYLARYPNGRRAEEVRRYSRME
jgi:transmembrane sensor